MYPPGSLGPGVFGPQAVQQPPQLQHPLGRHAVSQAVEVLAGQPLDRRGQRRQVDCPLGSHDQTSPAV
jgi:hypothetical protein